MDSTDIFGKIKLLLGNGQRRWNLPDKVILFLTLKLYRLKLGNYAQVNGSSSQFLAIISKNR